MIRQGKMRGEKVQYSDGLSCCVWVPLLSSEPEDYDDEIGVCFDFAFEDIDDLIALLQQLKAAEAEVYRETQ